MPYYPRARRRGLRDITPDLAKLPNINTYSNAFVQTYGHGGIFDLIFRPMSSALPDPFDPWNSVVNITTGHVTDSQMSTIGAQTFADQKAAGASDEEAQAAADQVVNYNKQAQGGTAADLAKSFLPTGTPSDWWWAGAGVAALFLVALAK